MRIPLLTPALAGLLIAPLAAQAPQAPARAAGPVFIASLRGTAEVPPIDTHAYGSAELTLSGSTIRYQVRSDELRDVTRVLLYVGRADQKNPAVATLFAGAKAGPVNGTLVSGTLRPRDLHGVTMSKLIKALRADDAYLDVRTREHPLGELRGELRLEQAPNKG